MTPGEYQGYSDSLIEKFDQILNDRTVQKNIEEAKTLLKGFGHYMENTDNSSTRSTDEK